MTETISVVDEGGFGCIMYVNGIAQCACQCHCNQEPILAGLCGDCVNRLHNGLRPGQIKDTVGVQGEVGDMIFVEFEEDFKNNITACFGCETVVTFEDLWFGVYCCKGCSIRQTTVGDKKK